MVLDFVQFREAETEKAQKIKSQFERDEVASNRAEMVKLRAENRRLKIELANLKQVQAYKQMT